MWIALLAGLALGGGGGMSELPIYIVNDSVDREALAREFDEKWASRAVDPEGDALVAGLDPKKVPDSRTLDQMGRSESEVARELAWALGQYPGRSRRLIPLAQHRLAEPALWRETARHLYIATTWHPPNRGNSVPSIFAAGVAQAGAPFWLAECRLLLCPPRDASQADWYRRYEGTVVLAALERRDGTLPESAVHAIGIVLSEKHPNVAPGFIEARVLYPLMDMLEKHNTSAAVRALAQGLDRSYVGEGALDSLAAMVLPGKLAILEEELAKLPPVSRRRARLTRLIESLRKGQGGTGSDASGR
jgi:hypothetical protein